MDRGERGLRWRARYRGPDGLVRSRSFATKVRAQRWLTDEQSKIDQAAWVNPDLGRITWAEYSDELQASRIHLAARTVETERRCHERAAELIGDVQLIRLSPELLRKVTTQLAGRYAPETVARTMHWVRLTLNQAVRDRRITASPADGVRLPRSLPTGMRLLDPSEVAALADALPDQYSSLATTAAYTGMRWGELAGLRVSALDLQRSRLTVRSTLVEATGQTPQLGPPKSKASERSIALPVSSSKPSPSISRRTRPSRTWCGPPNKELYFAEAPSDAYGAKPSPNPSGHRVGSMICAIRMPPG